MGYRYRRRLSGITNVAGAEGYAIFSLVFSEVCQSLYMVRRKLWTRFEHIPQRAALHWMH